ncbi:hypothetical protein HA402_005567 [Bradysia odoriphaga]|nr:hypothetical protein HA402_005567 [Bradysia odoriphaga]
MTTAETIFGDDDVDVRTAPESRNNQPLDYDDVEFNTAPTSHNNDPVELEFDENIIKEETIDITEISANIEREKLNLNRIRDKVLQYDKVSELQSVIDGLFKVIERLNAKLRQYQIDLEYFRDNNAKTLYYTGLPKFALLETFIFKLSPHIDRKSSNILSASRIIILTLMKLRLGLQFTDLGYRFQVSKQTASRAFFSCINTLYFKMKGMVYRPSREEVMNTMPNCFKTNFGDEVAHIIDCVELYIEAPYHFDTRIQCWSEYKHHYTLKYLVSITPQGMFEFISKGYGGRANDMLVTTSCNFLDILEPGDLVLADKGFNMHDVFKIRSVDLEIPAFVCNQQQLHPLAVEKTRKIANVRIHVERCIGLLRRKFMILHRIIPVSMLSKPVSASDNVPFMDKIITVCSALCNLCPTIIRDE